LKELLLEQGVGIGRKAIGGSMKDWRKLLNVPRLLVAGSRGEMRDASCQVLTALP